MKFEWDARKAARNLRKHGVSFQEAASVFLDHNGLELAFEGTVAEQRFLRIGLSLSARVLLVVHTERGIDEQETIRIISARRANRQERATYFSRAQGR